MAFSPGGGGVMSEINVTPLVDVMLVLLIIFMITAPMIDKKKESQRKIGVDLPQTDAAPVDVEEEKKIILEIDHKLVFRIGENQLADCAKEHKETTRTKGCLKELGEKLKLNQKLQADREIYLMADRRIPYGVVVSAMSVLKEAGVDQLGIVTDPPEAPRTE